MEYTKAKGGAKQRKIRSDLAGNLFCWQVEAELQKIDTQLTTTSMKLAQEKYLLRRKEHLKARLKDLSKYETVQADLQALKVSIRRWQLLTRLRGTRGIRPARMTRSCLVCYPKSLHMLAPVGHSYGRFALPVASYSARIQCALMWQSIMIHPRDGSLTCHFTWQARLALLVWAICAPREKKKEDHDAQISLQMVERNRSRFSPW